MPKLGRDGNSNLVTCSGVSGWIVSFERSSRAFSSEESEIVLLWRKSGFESVVLKFSFELWWCWKE